MFNPKGTYRIQFHKDFNFNHFENIIPYLEKLGVSTIYASPIFKSTPGSMHGYDGTDPLQINPEIGTLEQLRRISKTLKTKGILWLQDIVPNHMAFHADNPWLMDLLEKGPRSAYKNYFDTSLSSNLYQGSIMAPFVDSDLTDVIEQGQLQIACQLNRLILKYAAHTWPLQLSSYKAVIEKAQLKGDAWMQLINGINQAEKQTDTDAYSRSAENIKNQLAQILKDETAQKSIASALNKINQDKAFLTELVNEQYYRPCSWKETDLRINYRRFFTVNGLICLNIQHQQVFNHFHQLIVSLIKEGIFQGLRIDHIDGLYNPTQYLERLRKLCGPEVYIITEKILEQGEELPTSWPIQGSSGYDFLAVVNNLLTNYDAENQFTTFYRGITHNYTPAQDQVEEKKRLILTQHMAGDLDNLLNLLLKSGLVNHQKITNTELKQCIAELLIKCPVYRYYYNTLPLKGKEKNAVKALFKQISLQRPELSKATDVLFDLFISKTNHPEKATEFYQRCMQFSGPLMAKGVEDTLMYTDARFVSHNEVGGSTDTFGLTTNEFHELMQYRNKHWPMALNGTSTHDTKRGEDVRARLNALTAMPDDWFRAVRAWQKQNRSLKQDNAPDASDEYFIYQTLIGVYPMPGQPLDNLPQRLPAYLQKALREGKQHSDWGQPNEVYEQAAIKLALSIIDQQGPAWPIFEKLLKQVADFGIINSLAQVLLKFTCPGTPDVYQGCELWDLSLVDPDNRRPVDYLLREQLAEQLNHVSIRQLWDDRYNGQIKLWLTELMFTERKNQALLFAEGAYLPLQIEGLYKNHVLAFARQYRHVWYISIIPLKLGVLAKQQKKTLLKINWADTKVLLPSGAPEDFEHLLTGERANGKDGLLLSKVFNHLPLALLKLKHNNNGRAAGVLMHITALPSAYGIGDLGAGARAFADLLHRTHQKYWQMLPLGPLHEQGLYSPYSSWSGMGGNTLLISPEALVDDGLINSDLLKVEADGNQIDYAWVETFKNTLFDVAWRNFQSGRAGHLQSAFDEFCRREAYWLDDFALYALLKQHHQQHAWHEWPEPFKLRDARALKKFAAEYTDKINQIKFLQFLFAHQWHQLKAYCNGLGIELFGDLPFYVSYDSVDVWAHRDIFSLDDAGNIEFMAGVPPDYFNANGQLWGMPVFRWDKLKARGYDWWLQRIRKNMELYDLLRIDHFRAFSAYWAMPAGEKTAINGSWQPGPGSDLFSAILNDLGKLPFVAEDLGDIDDAVYQLRDEFNLPGMKVLQFAFGENMPYSPYIPHNYTANHLAYTGTHDNNTTIGWYRQDADKATRKRLKKYTGLQIDDENIHRVMIGMAMNSAARICIIPIQDWLGLDEKARINTPASVKNNWVWRLDKNQLKELPLKRMLRLTKLSGR